MNAEDWRMVAIFAYCMGAFLIGCSVLLLAWFGFRNFVRGCEDEAYRWGLHDGQSKAAERVRKGETPIPRTVPMMIASDRTLRYRKPC